MRSRCTHTCLLLAVVTPGRVSPSCSGGSVSKLGEARWNRRGSLSITFWVRSPSWGRRAGTQEDLTGWGAGALLGLGTALPKRIFQDGERRCSSGVGNGSPRSDTEGIELLRAELNGVLVHLLNHSDTVPVVMDQSTSVMWRALAACHGEHEENSNKRF